MPATSFRLSPMARARLEALARAIGTSRTKALELLLSADLAMPSAGLQSADRCRSSRHRLIRDAVVLMRLAAATLREPALRGGDPDLRAALARLIQRALTLVEQAADASPGPKAACIDSAALFRELNDDRA